MKPLHFLFGYKRYRIASKDCEAFLEVCRRHGAVYRDLKREEDFCEFICSYYTSARLIPLCRVLGIETERVSSHGLPSLVGRYKTRYGLILGMVTFWLIIYFSSSVIWDIRIDGERSLTEEQVTETLRKNGLHVGMLKKNINTDKIENRTLIFSDEISWISVNINGTVANVEIREVAAPDEEEESSLWAAGNIIAERDGTILYFEDARGNIITEVGEDVTKGQLLIGGVYDSENAGTRYTVASGRVIAETDREFRVEIPLEYEKKMPTGRVWSEKYLVFFEKEVKFFTNCGNSYASCDTIDIVNNYVPLNFADMGNIPIGVRTVYYEEYELCTLVRDETTAEGMAKYEMGKLIKDELGDGEILGIKYEGYVDGNKYVLRAFARCREDIAQQVEIELSLQK